MTRKEQLEEAAMTELAKTYNGTPVDYFVMGSEWADANPMVLAKDRINTLNAKLEIAREAFEEISKYDDTGYFGDLIRETLEKIK